MGTISPEEILLALKAQPAVDRGEVEEGGGAPASWVTTPASRDCRTILFFHDGEGFAGSTVDLIDLCTRLADAARAGVFSVDYRLCAGDSFPATVAGCLAAYRHLLDDGYPPAGIVPAGISAGGLLVISMLRAARDAGIAMPAAAVCLSPVVDMLFQGESVFFNQETDWLTPEDLAGIRGDLLAGHDPADPLASPLYADLNGLPPMLVQAGDGEILIDGIEAFVSTAELQGVPVTFDCTEGMFHCWQAFAGVLPEGAAAVERVGVFVRRLVPEGVGR